MTRQNFSRLVHRMMIVQYTSCQVTLPLAKIKEVCISSSCIVSYCACAYLFRTLFQPVAGIYFLASIIYLAMGAVALKLSLVVLTLFLLLAVILPSIFFLIYDSSATLDWSGLVHRDKPFRVSGVKVFNTSARLVA